MASDEALSYTDDVEYHLIEHMKNIKFILLVVLAAILVGCGTTKTVPITGRQQSLMVSDGEVLSLSTQQYQEFMKSAKLSTNATNTAMVKRVGEKLATAVTNYLRSNGMADDLQYYKWQFNLVQNNQVNAWCMPGGKIVVYEGIMNLVGSDDELAVVIGHEVAHAVAKHSNERMSQQVLAEYGAQAIGIFTSGKSAATQQIAQQVYGLGAQYGVMQPFSRKHESEADKMGLVLMTIAGYNPDVAVTFWQKMAATTTQEPPEFMSSHPSHATRIADIQKWLPEVKKQYGSN